MKLQTPEGITTDVSRDDLSAKLHDDALDYFWLSNGARHLLAIRRPDDTYQLEAWDGQAGQQGIDQLPYECLAPVFVGFLERDTAWRTRCRWCAIQPTPQGGLPIGVHVALVHLCAAALLALGAFTGFVLGHRVDPNSEMPAIVMALMLAPALAMATPYLARRLRARCPMCRHAAVWRCSATNFLYTCPACGHVHIRGKAGTAPVHPRPLP